MESDAGQLSKSEDKVIDSSVPRQSASPSPSFRCGQCALVFKSKPSLVEHQIEVHGLNTEFPLEDSGSNTSNPGVSKDNARRLFCCPHCQFTTSVWSIAIKHKKKCHGNAQRKVMAQHPQKRYLNGKLLGAKTSGSKSLDTGKKTNKTATVKDTSSLECKQLAGEKVSPPLFNSTPKTKPISDSSKDLKTYKRASPGSTIKYSVPNTVSNVNGRSNDLPGESSLASTTLILHSSPFARSKDGVFQVTATSRNDLVSQIHNNFLLFDPATRTDTRSSFEKGTFSTKAVKRANDEAPQNHIAKKARVDKEQSDGLGSGPAEGNLPNGSNFTFEVSDDEDAQDAQGCDLEEMLPPGNEKAGSSKVFCCKHCSYSHKNVRGMATHYQRMHPYIKYNFEYIGHEDDLSATFRCLECPVEFLTVDDLKKHYGENHPDAPNVFTSPERDLDLVFKCFVCPFTTSTSKLLRDHYKVTHPEHAENSLLYCKYTKRSQVELFQPGTCKEKSPTPTKKDETTVPEQSPVSKEVADELYHCKNCEFSNKSVVAMLVHYQKKHPKTGVTIDKIKQTALSTSQKIHKVPVVSLSSIPAELMEKSLSPQNKSSDVSSETKVKIVTSPEKPISKSSKTSLVRPEISIDKVGDISENKGVDASHNSSSTPTHAGLEDIDNLFFCQFCNYRHQTVWGISSHQKKKHGIVKRNAEAIHIHTAEVRSKGRSKEEMSPVQGIDETSLGMESSSATQEEDMYFCQFCDYNNVSVKSVLSHQNAKHGGLVSSDGILMYTANVREDKLQEKLKASTNEPSNCNPSSPVKVDRQKRESCQKRTTLPHRSTLPSNPYERAEDLFFCPQCNFGHTTLKGVLNHHGKRHKKFKAVGEQVSKYTEVIRQQIKKSKSKGKNLPHFPTGLPLPINHGVGQFFCNFCNFTQTVVQRVIEHYKKRHPGYNVTENQISTYSSMVYEQLSKSNLVVPQEQDVQVTATAQSEKAQENIQNPTLGSSLDFKKAMKIRQLKCRKCPYAAPHVYLLRRHLGSKHKMMLSMSEVLEMAYKDGQLQAGYHCQWCVFSHKEAKKVFKHCRKRHGDRGASLQYISSQLYVGPKTSLPKKKSKEVNPSQEAGGNEEKLYACQACSFRSGSLGGITNHYRAVHPWSVKEDGSVLGIRRKAPNESKLKQEIHSPTSRSCDSSPAQDKSEIAGVSSPPKKTSINLHACHLCFAHFNNQHGLHTHYGKKHPEYHYDEEDSAPKQEIERPTSEVMGKMQVFRCPRCTYVNMSQHGLLTHCQMRHPTFIARAHKLSTGEAYFADGACMKQRQPEKMRFGGYMCKNCPLTFVTPKKLKSHYAKDHKQTACNVLKPAPKQATVIKKQLLSKYLGTQGSILPTAFLKNKKSAAMKCHLCKYACNTTIGLKRHMHIHHKDECEAESKDCVYNCSLCSYTSSVRRYLVNHYKRIHGKAAFLTHFEPRYRKVKQEKLAAMTNTTVTPEDKKSTAKRKTCSFCSFQSYSEEDMAAHCRAEHPEDQAKTQRPPILYKCCLCHYSTVILKYLASHYKRTHSRAAFNTYFSLAKNQKPPKITKSESSVEVSKLFKAESANASRAQCKKCPKLFFNTRLLLCIHYIHFHGNDINMDFTVHSSSPNDLENYKCRHCNKEIKGTKRLHAHLERHNEMYRKKASNVPTSQKPDSCEKRQATKPNKLKAPEKLTEVETIQDLAKLNVTRVEVFTLAATPPSSPPKSPERAEPQVVSGGAKGHVCGQCGRSFMSAISLRVHKRSHAAMAALQRLETLPIYSSKEMFNKYVSYRTGTMKPYHCGLCSYRSNILGLLWSHLMKKHGDECPDIIASSSKPVSQSQDSKPNAEEEPIPCSSNQLEGNRQAQPDDESAFTQKPVYSEHPDVERQLNHYKLMMVQANAPQETKPAEDGLLHCEFCSFSSGHLSSIRRHYLNRHNGKKLLRCKDCSFFTGMRKTLEMHMETGHAHLQSVPTHQKMLRCPLCLYQTKNKNSMIDHIVLHREERTIPIEVRRPKLSRYLQGIVFRCHKCTFTSASDENLRLHLLKHDDVKPYKCRLCYFDCTQLSLLEAHLCDKHQVVRNHELVGQINLDQLEAKGGTAAKEDKDTDTNIQNGKHEKDLENMEKPGGILHENQQKQEGNAFIENNNGNIAEQNIAELAEDEKLNADTKFAHKMETTESQETKEINGINHNEDQVQRDILHQNEEKELGENQAGEKPGSGEKSTAELSNGSQPDQETAELSVASQPGQKTPDPSDAFQPGQETAKLSDASQPDQETAELSVASQPGQKTADLNDASQQGTATAGESTAGLMVATPAPLSQLCQKHTEDATVPRVAQQRTDATVKDATRLDGDRDEASLRNPQDGHEVKTQLTEHKENDNHGSPKDTKTQDSSIAEQRGLAEDGCDQTEILREYQTTDSTDGSFMSCEEDQAHREPKHESVDRFAEMPVLEKECTAKCVPEENHFSSEMVNEDEGDTPHAVKGQVQDGVDEKTHEESSTAVEEQEGMKIINRPHLSTAPHDAFSIGGAAGVPFPTSSKSKTFACHYCGRIFLNSIELKQHVMRHGM